MPDINKTRRLPKQKYYELHLSLINCILPKKMTPMEITVIASFMSLNGDLANYRFGPTAKKKIMQDLNLKPGGLSNYMGALTEKGFLIKSGDVINILPLLVPEENEQLYHFKIIKEEV